MDNDKNQDEERKERLPPWGRLMKDENGEVFWRVPKTELDRTNKILEAYEKDMEKKV